MIEDIRELQDRFRCREMSKIASVERSYGRARKFKNEFLGQQDTDLQLKRKRRE